MADYSLKAVTNPLFLQDDQSEATTEVNYSALYPIFLWKRVNSGPVNGGPGWFREDLNDPMPATLQEAMDRQRKGTRTSDSGGFVEYGMLLGCLSDHQLSAWLKHVGGRWAR
jgi:hypothetical protein